MHRLNVLSDNISKRISNISSDKATFNNVALFYNDVLSASGCKENLTYQQVLPLSKKVIYIYIYIYIYTYIFIYIIYIYTYI